MLAFVERVLSGFRTINHSECLRETVVFVSMIMFYIVLHPQESVIASHPNTCDFAALSSHLLGKPSGKVPMPPQQKPEGHGRPRSGGTELLGGRSSFFPQIDGQTIPRDDGFSVTTFLEPFPMSCWNYLERLFLSKSHLVQLPGLKNGAPRSSIVSMFCYCCESQPEVTVEVHSSPVLDEAIVDFWVLARYFCFSANFEI